MKYQRFNSFKEMHQFIDSHKVAIKSCRYEYNKHKTTIWIVYD